MRYRLLPPRPANPQLAPLPPALAVTLVGGINELLPQSVDPYAGAGPGRSRPAAFAAAHSPPTGNAVRGHSDSGEDGGHGEQRAVR